MKIKIKQSPKKLLNFVIEKINRKTTGMDKWKYLSKLDILDIVIFAINPEVPKTKNILATEENQIVLYNSPLCSYLVLMNSLKVKKNTK